VPAPPTAPRKKQRLRRRPRILAAARQEIRDQRCWGDAGDELSSARAVIPLHADGKRHTVWYSWRRWRSRGWGRPPWPDSRFGSYLTAAGRSPISNAHRKAPVPFRGPRRAPAKKRRPSTRSLPRTRMRAGGSKQPVQRTGKSSKLSEESSTRSRLWRSGARRCRALTTLCARDEGDRSDALAAGACPCALMACSERFAPDVVAKSTSDSNAIGKSGRDATFGRGLLTRVLHGRTI